MNPRAALLTLLLAALGAPGTCGELQVQGSVPMSQKPPPPTLLGCEIECYTFLVLQCNILASMMPIYCLLPFFDGSVEMLLAYNPWIDCYDPYTVIAENTTVCGQPVNVQGSPPPVPSPSPEPPVPSPSPRPSPPPRSPGPSPQPYSPTVKVESTGGQAGLPGLFPAPGNVGGSQITPPPGDDEVVATPDNAQQVAAWPPWLPSWQEGGELLAAVVQRCPGLKDGEEEEPESEESSVLLEALVLPQLCSANKSAVSLVGAIGAGFFTCNSSSCVYDPLFGQRQEEGEEEPVRFWVWDADGGCWANDIAGNPCDVPPAQIAAWAAAAEAWWAADALLQRTAAAAAEGSLDADLAPVDLGLPGVGEWWRTELAQPGPSRNLSDLMQAALELAASPVGREVLLQLGPADPLRAWQEGAAQAEARAAECEAAEQSGPSSAAAACLCTSEEPLLHCRAVDAVAQGLGLRRLAAAAEASADTAPDTTVGEGP